MKEWEIKEITSEMRKKKKKNQQPGKEEENQRRKKSPESLFSHKKTASKTLGISTSFHKLLCFWHLK